MVAQLCCTGKAELYAVYTASWQSTVFDIDSGGGLSQSCGAG